MKKRFSLALLCALVIGATAFAADKQPQPSVSSICVLSEAPFTVTVGGKTEPVAVKQATPVLANPVLAPAPAVSAIPKGAADEVKVFKSLQRSIQANSFAVVMLDVFLVVIVICLLKALPPSSKSHKGFPYTVKEGDNITIRGYDGPLPVGTIIDVTDAPQFAVKLKPDDPKSPSAAPATDQPEVKA
jgi:hypothetical protein